ncbi:MAG: glycosyltransferase family 4 protein [archaeon]
MKILIVVPYFHPSAGGLQQYALNLHNYLKDNKHEVVIVTSNKENKLKEEKINNTRIYRLPTLFRISNTPINFFWVKHLRRIIETEKPDLINAHLPVPFIADLAARVAKERKIPFILTYQNDLIKENPLLNLLCKAYYFFLGNKTLEISKKIIVNSFYYAETSPHLKKHLKKVSCVPPSVDVKKFNLSINRDWLKRKYNLKNNIVLFVGQLDKSHNHKGLKYLIEAIKKIKEEKTPIKLLIVGEGDNINYFKKISKKIGIEEDIIFAGKKEKTLPLHYAGSNVTVLPSTNRSEGFGIVLIESMACGTPVIGTRVGGIPAVIDDKKDGFLVEPKNSIELSKAIKKILTEKELSKEMGLNGAKKVQEKYSIEKFGKKTLKLFNEVTKE